MSLLNVCTSANLNFWISGNRDLPSLTGWCSVSLWLLSSASVTKFRLHMRQRWRFVLCLVWSRLSDYKYKTKYIKVNILVIWQKSAIKNKPLIFFYYTEKKISTFVCFLDFRSMDHLVVSIPFRFVGEVLSADHTAMQLFLVLVAVMSTKRILWAHIQVTLRTLEFCN